MKILDTERLSLRKFSLDDAEFVFTIVNDADWLQYIGDKGVRTLDDARKYITSGPLDMYAKRGFGLYVVELKGEGTPIGICGLIKRDTLEDVDIGFAFLPAYRGSGYALESAAAVLDYGRRVLGIDRIVAITSPDNERSGRLLEKIGLKFEKLLELSATDTVRLYVPA